jgi:4-hydroxy-3-methylbut-2-enyl diphosphate reductase
VSALFDRSGADAGLLLLAPLRIEARALASGSTFASVMRTGAGMSKAESAAGRIRSATAPRAVAIAGVAGGLTTDLEPGTLVVADRVVDATTGSLVTELASASLIASELRRRGLSAVVGSVASSPRLVRGANARSALARTGAIAVDMETAALVRHPWSAPVAVVRAIADTPGRELGSPATISCGRRALSALKAAVPVLEDWSAAAGERDLLLAGPRSFCAGVERAIETVIRTLDRFGAPVYVRRQIVHNRHVVEELEERGAVFVHELDEVPDGATVVFSAHGVAPAVRTAAGGRDLTVIDATCPLVAKVHHEVHRFKSRGYQIVLIGHSGHDETEGTLGEDPGITLIETEADVDNLDVRDPEKVAYITQTTLSPGDVSNVVGALSRRFPAIIGPSAGDICYATQNRQEAVVAIAGECDLMLVIGSANSSNTARLVESAERAGCRAQMVDDDHDIRLEWLTGTHTIGVTAGASAPPALVDRVVAALSGLGPLRVIERPVRQEHVSFPLPVEVR